MNTYRTNAIVAGVLYIIGTVAGILSLALSQPLRDARDPLAGAAANANQVIVAALCVLLMGLSLAMVPVVLYPVLKRHSQVLALGYVVFRGALETIPVLWRRSPGCCSWQWASRTHRPEPLRRPAFKPQALCC